MLLASPSSIALAKAEKPYWHLWGYWLAPPLCIWVARCTSLSRTRTLSFRKVGRRLIWARCDVLCLQINSLSQLWDSLDLGLNVEGTGKPLDVFVTRLQDLARNVVAGWFRRERPSNNRFERSPV